MMLILALLGIPFAATARQDFSDVVVEATPIRAGLYPFIDLGSGGGIHGVIAAVERALELADDETIVVPGHGPLSIRAELAAYGAMLAVFRDRIAALKAEGMSLEQVVAAQPTAEFGERPGGGFIPRARLVGSIYNPL